MTPMSNPYTPGNDKNKNDNASEQKQNNNASDNNDSDGLGGLSVIGIKEAPVARVSICR